MLNNFRNLNSLYQSLGARWLMFRLGYALRKRTGFLRKQNPGYNWHDRPLETWLKEGIPSQPEAYAQWRKQNSPKFFFKPFRAERSDSVDEAQISRKLPWNPKHAINEAERVLNGELKYFDHGFIKTGFPPDWHQFPSPLQPPSSAARMSPKTKSDSNKHWSEISDDGDVDIKFIWEPSRFSVVYTLVRAYASTRGGTFAEAFWKLIQSWAESNLPNTGPNWMDGQEAALRLMAWTFGLYAFMDSPSSTPERIAQFTVMVAAHAERIYKNIDYAISTRSNHTISEAFGLWLVGLLFPEVKDAEKYLSLGRKLLEQEARAQIFPDGSYAMYSLNYHRFILHIYFWMIRLAQLNQSRVSSLVLDRITTSIDFLYQLIDPETGQMPVYGSNDGALVLPLNNCDFTDYRPLLQLGSYLTKGTRFFESGAWDEPLFWLFGAQALQAKVDAPPRTGQSYRDGGVYILRDSHSKAVIRCTDFRARPSHADQLHVDFWWCGMNIACDAGTYLYSGQGIWRNGLAHTSVHNTVTVDHQDQMKMVSRFTWTKWAKGRVIEQSSSNGLQVWQGEHHGYERLPDAVNHKRTVLSLGEDRWLVVDHLDGKKPHLYSLHWLLTDVNYGVEELAPAIFGIWLDVLDSKCRHGATATLSDPRIFLQMGLMEGNGKFSVVRGDERSSRGWRSRYYGDKEPAISALLETTQPHACFWTFFGFETDTVNLAKNTLYISSGDWKTSINLDKLNT